MSRQMFVLTTVGISVFLNILDDNEAEWRKRINREANARELSSEVADKTEQLAEKILDRLRKGEVDANRRLSAELNGLYGLYENQLTQARGDQHWLIATDTFLGRRAAEVVDVFLREQGLMSNIYVPSDLSSAEPRQFSAGIKRLMRWCEETIPGYREGYQVVFNLTGAFKSLQGYLNIVGMFYADEIVYIFETGHQLLRIPRLPLQVDIHALRAWRVELALMAQGHVYGGEQVGGIPAGLLDTDSNGDASLSDWGELIWNRTVRDLLGEDLLPFPRLQYTDTFRKDFKQASAAEKAELQQVLAKVSSLLEGNGGNSSVLKRDGGLQYDNYTGKSAKDGRPIGHFRVSQSRRVSCTVEDGALRLRRYGEHSINDNP